MANPAFPAVPPFPGVPPLARLAVNELLPQMKRLTADSPSVAGQFSSTPAPQWGVYKNDGITPVLIGDAVVSVDFDSERNIPTYPMEKGSFQSYNKVARPREMSVVFSQGGSKSDRVRFLNAVATVLDSTDLFAIVQPERTYTNMNFVRVHYDRGAVEGPQLLVVEVVAQEVRLSASSAFSDTKSPNDADAANQGTVQTQPPTASQSATMTTPQ